MEKKRVVIIGAGVAGITAALTVKKLRKDYSVLLIDAQKDIGFSPCLLPYYIGGEVSEKQLTKFQTSEIEEQGVELVLGAKVIEIDTKRKEVYLKEKENDAIKTIKYDVLVLATGGDVFVPPVNISQDARIFILKTPENAKDIIEAARKYKRAAVVGAGGIGIELAEALSKRKIKVYLIERERHVLYPLLDQELAEIIEQELKKLGVELFRNALIHEIDKNVISLQDGQKISVDFVVFATGIKPRIDIAKNAGIKCRRGIVVDERMRTNIKHVYACGDCVEVRDFITGELTRSRFATNAVKQAMVVARNICGFKTKFRPLLDNWISRVSDMYFGACGFSEYIATGAGIRIVYAMRRGQNGMMKLICNEEGTIIGFQAAMRSKCVADLLNMVAVMIREKVSVKELMKYDFCYNPIVSDIFHPIEMLARACARKLKK